MRAGLRESAASNLFNLGQSALTPHAQIMQTTPGTEGILSQLGPAAGTAIGTAFGGPIGGALGNFAGSLFKNKTNDSSGAGTFGTTSPYGGSSPSSYQGSFGELPKYAQR
jgi:hypothetical protein